MFNRILMILFACILCLFAISGFIEFIKSIIFRLYNLKNDNCIILIKPSSDSNYNIEYHLRSIIAKIRWMGKNRPQKIIFINRELNSEETKICEIIKKEYSFLEFVTKEDFINSI